jgi:hypothetical protein
MTTYLAISPSEHPLEPWDLEEHLNQSFEEGYELVCFDPAGNAWLKKRTGLLSVLFGAED